MSSGDRVLVGGPYFEDFAIGQRFGAPAVTLTSGHATLHQAIAGDRLMLPLDAELSRAVTGRAEALIHPNLVCDIAIGQSTGPTQRVRGNLFYRGLVLLAPVFVGDTLRTETEVVALKQNRAREGLATGLVALRITTENQDGRTVLDFWRCPMIPLRDAEAQTGHADGFDAIPADIDIARLHGAVPSNWNLAPLRARLADQPFEHPRAGLTLVVEGRETVTAAPELARMTLNVAMAHLDATSSDRGRRLVYGGHTISIAAAHLARAIPGLVTLLAWRSCDHLGPVFEGDVLASEVDVAGVEPLRDGGSRLLDLRVRVAAHRAESDSREDVLDWRVVALDVDP